MAAMKLLVAAALTSVALAAPVEERQSCQSVWGQCGGIGWSGLTCCATGNTCVAQNPYYSQCLPNSQVTTTAAGTTTTTSTTSTVPKTSTSTTSVKSTASSGTKATSTSTKASTTTTKATTTAPVGTGAAWSGNPFTGIQMWPNKYYASEVSSLAVPSLTGAMATAAAKVASVPSFMWLDTYSKIALMESTMADIHAANAAGANPPNAGIFVVYDLPDRDCAAAASNGEYSIANNGVANYKNYIDGIKAVLTKYSDTRVILIVEPDSLANLVTNMNVAKCSNAHDAYLTCVNYAITQLNLPNVAMYLDAGHAGWLGWSANLSPAAQLFASVYKNASSPAAVRGLATNVANYNAWTIASAPSYTQGDSNYDESLYVQALAPLLQQNGWTDVHFVTDTGRSGKQPTQQQQWGDWCNVIGTGFGTRPTTNTGLELEDAFVWIKPGGECDGTSNTTSPRYDYYCGLSDALQPAPEAGTWFQAYFVQLLTNANPSFL